MARHNSGSLVNTRRLPGVNARPCTRMALTFCWLLGLLFVIGASIASPPAMAESLCTNTWIGPSEGAWTTAKIGLRGTSPPRQKLRA